MRGIDLQVDSPERSFPMIMFPDRGSQDLTTPIHEPRAALYTRLMGGL